MKFFQKILLFILFTGISITSASAQSIILKSFSLSQINESVFLKWTILQGETCNGIKIFRSIDNINFIQVGDISGVCGSPDFAQPFEFIDEQPAKNKTNYYKLELGNTGFSEVKSIQVISLNTDGVLIFPNPTSESTTVYFKNDYSSPHIFRLYTNSGALVFELEGKTDSFFIDTSTLSAGIYIFSISGGDNGSPATGKISVVH